MKFQNVTGQQFFEAKSEDFFRAASDIGFCVFPRLNSPRGVSDKATDNERTFWCQQGARTKVLKLSAVCGHTTWNVPNLEKHR